MYTANAVDRCVVIGHNSLFYANTDTADGTVAIGYGAGFNYIPVDATAATGGTTLIGYKAGYDDADDDFGLTTGLYNTAVGHETLGAGAGDALTGNANTVMGYRAGYGMRGGAAYNTCIGRVAGDGLTTGSGNTYIGNSTDGTPATSYQTAVGYAASAQHPYETRVGNYGGLQFYSREVELTYSDATADTVAQTGYAFIIPARAIIKSITAVVTILSSNAAAEFNIVRSTDSAVSGEGTALTGTNTEILGAGAAGTTNTGGFNSGGVNDINCDIASQDGVLYASWHNNTLATLNPNDASTTSTSYIWVQNAINNGDSDPSTAPIIRVCVEFIGQSA